MQHATFYIFSAALRIPLARYKLKGQSLGISHEMNNTKKLGANNSCPHWVHQIALLEYINKLIDQLLLERNNKVGSLQSSPSVDLIGLQLIPLLLRSTGIISDLLTLIQVAIYWTCARTGIDTNAI